jgi:thiamine-phosphate pyrophosphorylase
VTDASHRPARRAAAPFQLPSLYPIIDIDLCRLRGLDPLAAARACLEGGARLLQVRDKGQAIGSGALLAIVGRMIAAAGRFDAAVIVNDRADIAAIGGAIGVHVGQQDLPVEVVRAIVNRPIVVGVSTHTREQIDESLEGPADYLAVGPIFRTGTKDTGYEPRGLELIRYAAGRCKPIVAIGGVTAANARAVLEAGAASIAVISEVLSATDPERRVRELLRILSE